MRKAFTVIIAVLLLTAPAYANGSGPFSITGRVDSARNVIVLESSVLTVEVSEKQPTVEFYYTGDRLNMTHFRVSLEKIVEYDENLRIAQECNLTAWSGVYGGPTAIQSGGGAEVGVGVQQVLLKNPSVPFLIVFSEFSMYYSNYTETNQLGTLKVTTATLGGVELKTTIRVVDWPFKNPDKDRLALLFRIEKEIPNETSEHHSFKLEQGVSESTLSIVGDDTTVKEGFLRWSNSALTSNASSYYLTQIVTTNLNETSHDAELTLVYAPMHTSVASLLEQTMTIGVVEENAEFIVHPTPVTLAPEVIITAAAVTLVVLAIVIVKARSKKI